MKDLLRTMIAHSTTDVHTVCEDLRMKNSKRSVCKITAETRTK